MAANWKVLTEFLVDLGIDQISHTQKNYLGHLINVHNLLKGGGYDADICHAGLFHSIYGTEKFQGFKLPVERREELVGLIGSRAERLAYWNCFMDRSSLDALLGQSAAPFLIQHREIGESLPLTLREYDDLCCVHLYDWLEQAPRSRFGWDYRRRAYRQMAERIGGHAVETYDRVYAGEPPVAIT